MTFNPGDVVTVDFPGITGVKRRPAVILSSTTYHAIRPDVIVGLITTQTNALGQLIIHSKIGQHQVYELLLFFAVLSSLCHHLLI